MALSELLDTAIQNVENNPIEASLDRDYKRFAFEALQYSRTFATHLMDKHKMYAGYNDVAQLLDGDLTKTTIQRAVLEGMLIGFNYAKELEKSHASA